MLAALTGVIAGSLKNNNGENQWQHMWRNGENAIENRKRLANQ